MEPALTVTENLKDQTNDNPGIGLVSAPLTGNNYPTWARSIRFALGAKRKLGFIDGSYEKPSEDKAAIEQWQTNDCMVVCWIVNSIAKDIAEAFLYAKSARELWDELQSLDPLPTCDCGASKKIAEKTASSQLMQFLMGLSNVYDHVRNQILLMDPLPTVGKAYSMVARVEKQWEIHSGVTTVHKEGIMNVQTEIRRGTFNKGTLKKGNLDKRSLFYEHCKKNGHTKQGCFEINGFPDSYKLLAEQKKKGNKPPNTRALNVNLGNGESSLQHTLSEIVKTEIKKALQGEESSQYFSNYAESEEFAGMSLKPTAFMNKIENTWVIGSGASAHMCANAALFDFLKPLDNETSIKLPNGIVQKVKLAGNIRLTKSILLTEVLYVPDFKYNLLSANRLCRDNPFKVIFTKDDCTMQDLQTNHVIAVGRQENRLYILGMDKIKDTDLTNNVEDITKTGDRETHMLKTVDIRNLWHSRLGHAGMDVVKKLHLYDDNKTDQIKCIVCPLAKQHRTTFPTSDSKTENAFDLVHVDVWGPYKEYSISHCHYMLTLVDDYSRATWTYMMIHKSQAQEKLEQFYNLIHTQFDCKIKQIKTDNGTEFTNENCQIFFKNKGIIHQKSCAYTPQQNGKVERKHRHLLEVARSLMFQASMLQKFWTEALLTATYIINRLPSHALN
ncbi:UNVERIFIED_CONTAM: Copia protein [Sesamum indicum]